MGEQGSRKTSLLALCTEFSKCIPFGFGSKATGEMFWKSVEEEWFKQTYGQIELNSL